MADLVSSGEIAQFPGAPFPADVLTAAGETVRKACGWMIAPTVTGAVETLDSDGGSTLYVQSKYVTALTQVRDMTGTAPVVLTGVTFNANGRLYLRTGFPCGVGAVEVTYTHGYTACPKDLLPVVADLARSANTSTKVRQQTMGSASITFSTSSATVDPSSPMYNYAIPAI